jgi:hypothetical protein
MLHRHEIVEISREDNLTFKMRQPLDPEGYLISPHLFAHTIFHIAFERQHGRMRTLRNMDTKTIH